MVNLLKKFNIYRNLFNLIRNIVLWVIIIINWDTVAGIYNTTLTLFFAFVAFFMFIIAIKGYKAKNHYGGSSTLVCGLLFIFFAYYNSIIGFLPFPFVGFIVWWIGVLISINFAFSLLIKITIKKMGLEIQNQDGIESKNKKKNKLKNFIYLLTKESPYKEDISIKMEFIRKSFHSLGILLLLAYFGFIVIPPLAQIMNDNVLIIIEDTKWLYNILWGDTNDYPYDKGDFQVNIDFAAFGLIGAIIFMIISELIRILWGPEYSIFNFLTNSVLRKKEYNAFGAQIYLITGITFAYMIYLVGLSNILTFAVGMLIACFSDAIAALIGKKYGKHKVKCIGGDIKSIEGFIAGTGSAYFIALIFVGPIYALIAALIFFILDYFPTIIADNLLNPILITIGLSICIYLIGFPIGCF